MSVTIDPNSKHRFTTAKEEGCRSPLTHTPNIGFRHPKKKGVGHQRPELQTSVYDIQGRRVSVTIGPNPKHQFTTSKKERCRKERPGVCHRSLQDMDCPHFLYLRPSFMCLHGLSSIPVPTTEFYVLTWIVHLSCTYDRILCAYMDCPHFLYLRHRVLCAYMDCPPFLGLRLSFIFLHGLSTFPGPTTVLCACMDCPPFLYLRQSFMCLHPRLFRVVD